MHARSRPWPGGLSTSEGVMDTRTKCRALPSSHIYRAVKIGNTTPVEGLGMLPTRFGTRYSALVCCSEALGQRHFIAKWHYERSVHFRHRFWQSARVAHNRRDRKSVG